MEDFKVLALNADFMPLNLVPLSTISWQKAFKLIVEGIAVPINFYEGEFVHTPSTRYPVPSVIVMKDYKRFNKRAKWSKFNVKLRDNFICQYCLRKFSHRSLTIDHVKPKSQGGKHSWLNSVSACKPCNQDKKDHRHIKPKNKPYHPSYYELAKKMMLYKQYSNKEWSQYVDYLK